MSHLRATDAETPLSGDVLLSADVLKWFAEAVLRKAGVADEIAAAVAWSLVEADLRGHSSHGVMRLPVIVRRIRAGAYNLETLPSVVSETPTTGVIDAANGFGQVALQMAVDLAIQKAQGANVAVAVVRRSQNFGSLGPYAERIAERGLIGFVCTNGAPAMTPPGGRGRVLGTNPLAISIPYKEAITLDMATSVVARDKITLARKSGRPIPEGWALDADGNPTTDPAEALEGSLLPVGGHKGFGLALAIEVLAACLSDSSIGTEVGWLYETTRPQGVGHLVAALRPDAFIPAVRFAQNVERLASMVKQATRPEPGATVYLPGEPEHRTRRQRL
ncbi:MAG: Ldh family oxidoreductase, partial [Bacillota bacterium]